MINANGKAVLYYLLNNTPGQPFPDIRVKVVTGDPDTDNCVEVMCCDLRLVGVTSLAMVENLTFLDEG